ncbi:hypothetical protein [Rhizobium sp. LCM 4573]|uniref:hypothetical protein n=1 Tax=Rhizobium sp. LCM 4573 TaxID=1848291 RepID=UPI0008D94393|nr:hypothetical protein [Rhizobium sp. LCM 4573]OHV76583.1 hypothetical protein LCM4573_13335 [Rhizobium sp. LCM 4573]
MGQRLSGILIAGSSHVGKTTLARRLAETLGWNMESTDRLGRHPGRPWPGIPQPVAEYYARLSPETIYWFLKVHHENVWPGIRRMIESEIDAERPLILEGSALRPEFIAPLLSDAVAGIYLHADTDFLRERMRSEAGYRQADEPARAIMDKFIERSLRDNSEMREAATQHGVAVVDVSDSRAVAGLFDDLVRRAS